MPIPGGPHVHSVLAMQLENRNAIVYGAARVRRSPTVAQLAATAVFLASDGAGAITGTFVNVTSGMFPS
jgi:hypothetical protein